MMTVTLMSSTGNSQSLVDQTPKQEILVVQGDWNAKVGEDAQEDWGEVCGPSCNPETNDRGLKLLDFATYNNLVLANTLGNLKPSKRWTWHSPDGTHHNQIEYILVKKRFRSGIKTARTRTFPGADVGSDHDMVMMIFQTRLKSSRKPTQPRIWFDLEKLNDPTVMSAFQATIGGRFAPLAEYCSDLYNYETDGDPKVLDCPQIPDEEHHPILREEVEAAVKALKMGKSTGVDNIPAELVQAGGEAMIDILTAICNKIWKTGECPTTWIQSLVITLPKKGNLQLCQNYRTISLISHPSTVKIILNRLQPQAEEIIAEEQAGFRAGRSTTEQIFNLRILCEKYLQHQQNLYHAFIDFKKAFDRVWHEALWATMRKYNINASIIRAIENLYDKAQSAVLFNGSTGEWFRTTVGVREGCLLSPTLFNIFLERIMCEALDDHEGSVSIGVDSLTTSALQMTLS